MKTVTLTPETWANIVRRLTTEVGADDDSRRWAAMITEQTSGAVKVTATRGGVQIKAGKGGDLRKMLGV